MGISDRYNLFASEDKIPYQSFLFINHLKIVLEMNFCPERVVEMTRMTKAKGIRRSDAPGRLYKMQEQGELRVSIRYRYLEVHRPTTMNIDNSTSRSVSIYLGESIVDNLNNTAFLPFVVIVELQPGVGSFEMRGDIFLEYPDGKPCMVDGDGEAKPPEVWVYLYKNSMDVIAELAKRLGIELPEETIIFGDGA